MNLMIDVDDDDNKYHGQKEDSYDDYKEMLDLPNNFDNLPPGKQIKLILSGLKKYKEATKDKNKTNPFSKTYKNLNQISLEKRQSRSIHRTTPRPGPRSRAVSRHTNRSKGGTRKNTKSRRRKK
jgi:hypothetical protein